MDFLVVLMFSLLFRPSEALALITPRTVPASLAAIWVVQQQPSEHPWETRLRAVEAAQAKQTAVAELLIKELNAINANRTERLEIVERWKREQERVALESPVPDKPSPIDPEKLDAVVEALKQKPVDWDIIGTGIGVVLASAVAGYIRHRSMSGKIDKKLDEAIAIPPPAKPDDRLRVGPGDERISLGNL